jgi:hypothetical protein
VAKKQKSPPRSVPAPLAPIPEIAPLALSADEQPIEGARAIALAIGGHYVKNGKPRTQLAKVRLMANQIPHFRVGTGDRQRYVTNLRLLKTMSGKVVAR